MWSVIGVVAAFFLIFILVIKKFNIGLSLLVGSLVLGVFSSPLSKVLETVFNAIIDHSTLLLVANIVSITFFNYAYQNTGKFKDLARDLGKMIPSTRLVALIPVLFGVLPVSGGALFSAPLVDIEGNKISITKERKAFLNIWFRHIPHLLYPLETALIIASHLTGISLETMILYQTPVFIVGIIFGYLFGLNDLKKEDGVVVVKWSHIKSFLLSFMPILIVVLLTAIFKIPVFISIIVGTAILLAMERPSIKDLDLLPTSKEIGKMALVAFGIMIFRFVVDSSKALEFVAELAQTYSIWPPILFISLPLLIGFALGESSPSITLALSIILTTYSLNPASACLVYTSMYLGHLITPLHLCYSVTLEYFQVETSKIYKRLIPATLATLILDIPLMIFLM